MADYDTWNQALIRYFVQETAVGAPVFLAADEDTIGRIGRLFLNIAAHSDPVLDFQTAVRSQVVRRTNTVDLIPVERTGANAEPQGAGFLCALVLAASRMRDSDDIGDVNYFTRLRDVLGLPQEGGRPDGMRSGEEAEEPLWRLWNLWLQVQGRLPTATPGPERHPHRFIHYARSQALLREVDKDQLQRMFRTGGWRGDFDTETVLLRVRRQAPHLTVHLREVLGSDSDRIQAVAEAIHDLYERWRLDPSGVVVPGSRSRVLYAGIYREEDPLAGFATYHLYPRATRAIGGPMRASIGGSLETLRQERQGWYSPLGPLDGPTLTSGARYPIEQPADAEDLVFPARDFWILIPDPQDPARGTFASWGQPQLGLPFVLLCKQQVLAQLHDLKLERLVQYADEPMAVLDGSWFEVPDCRFVSEAWSGAHLNNPELYDALRPADVCNVSTSGGLRVPGRPSWLDTAGPHITVFGYAPDAEVTVTDVRTNRTIVERTQRTGEAGAIAWPGPGTYLVTGSCAGQEARPRMVIIEPWDDLRIAAPAERVTLVIGGFRLCGAALD